MQIEFQCPRCGGAYFGSYNNAEGVYIASCHDQNDSGCNWSGPYDFDTSKKQVDEIIAKLATQYKITPDNIVEIWDTLSDLPIS